MADHVLVGCADLPHGVGWGRYFGKLSFLELSALARPSGKRAAPRAAVLAKWRAAAPGPGAFSVVTPALTDRPPGFAGGIEPVVAAAGTLEASAIVVRTPASFSPSAANRDLLRRLFGEVATAEAFGDAARVWLPEGLWEVPTALKLATELELVLGIDPSLRDPTRDPPDAYAHLEAEAVYFRVSGLGRGPRRLGPAQLEELAALATAYPRTWMVFATVDAFVDATRFRRVLADFEPPEDVEDVEDVEDDDDDDDADQK